MSIFVDHKALKHKLKKLADVYIWEPQNLDWLIYSAGYKQWVNVPQPGLEDLKDVYFPIKPPFDGQVLTYIGADKKWENKPAPPGAALGFAYVTAENYIQKITPSSYEDIPNMSITKTLRAGSTAMIHFMINIWSNVILSPLWAIRGLMDGIVEDPWFPLVGGEPVAPCRMNQYATHVWPNVSAGSHTFTEQWYNYGNYPLMASYRRMVLIEIPAPV